LSGADPLLRISIQSGVNWSTVVRDAWLALTISLIRIGLAARVVSVGCGITLTIGKVGAISLGNMAQPGKTAINKANRAASKVKRLPRADSVRDPACISNNPPLKIRVRQIRPK
jgi:hypothetical protein